MKNKRSILLTGSLAAFLAVALCPFTPALRAQSRSQSPSSQQQPGQQPAQQNNTFTGKVAQLQNGKYALVTGKTAQGGLAGHYLDDPTDAKKFVGKDVKVTGTLDATNNMIHVTKIELA